MDILGKLFGSPARIKLIRLFILNPELIFDQREIRRRLKLSPTACRRELRLLAELKLIRPKTGPIGAIETSPKAIAANRGVARAKGWQLNPEFPFLLHLDSLLTAEILARRTALASRFKKCGAIKFVSVAGIFLPNGDGRTVDILVVGDRLKRSAIEHTVRGIEAEIGRELRYAVFETKDFNYRLSAYDKFVRDILDFPHERIIDKIKVI